MLHSEGERGTKRPCFFLQVFDRAHGSDGEFAIATAPAPNSDVLGLPAPCLTSDSFVFSNRKILVSNGNSNFAKSRNNEFQTSVTVALDRGVEVDLEQYYIYGIVMKIFHQCG